MSDNSELKPFPHEHFPTMTPYCASCVEARPTEPRIETARTWDGVAE